MAKETLYSKKKVYYSVFSLQIMQKGDIMVGWIGQTALAAKPTIKGAY